MRLAFISSFSVFLLRNVFYELMWNTDFFFFLKVGFVWIKTGKSLIITQNMGKWFRQVAYVAE